MLINIIQGETAVIEIDVVDSSGAAMDLTGAEGIFAYKKYGTTTVTKKACTIQGNIVSVKLLPSETKDLLGKYTFEIKLKDVYTDIGNIAEDFFIVSQSILPVYSLT